MGDFAYVYPFLFRFLLILYLVSISPVCTWGGNYFNHSVYCIIFNVAGSSAQTGQILGIKALHISHVNMFIIFLHKLMLSMPR